jgi:hypothetical protein
VRGQSDQHQNDNRQCTRHGSRLPASQAVSPSLHGMPRASPMATFNEWMAPVASKKPHVLHRWSTHW